MQFVINGTAYEAVSLEQIDGAMALALAKQVGMGVQTLARRLDEIPRLSLVDGVVVALPATDDDSPPEGADPDLVTESEPHLRALFALMWVSRRLDGDASLTFADALGFRFVDFSISVADRETETETEPDPSQPSDGVADATDGADASPTTSTDSTTSTHT